MKKILLLLLPLIAMTANAQGRHEVSVFLGGPVTEFSSYSNNRSFNQIDLYSIYEPRYVTDSGVNFGIDYTYTLKNWLKLGVQADMSIFTMRVYAPEVEGPFVEYGNHSFYTASLLPVAKFFCLNKRIVKLYGKVGAGISFAFSNVKESRVAFAYEIVPIGIQLGGQRIYCTSEFVTGTEIVGFRIGCGFRF